jgi:hypothetical protein
MKDISRPSLSETVSDPVQWIGEDCQTCVVEGILPIEALEEVAGQGRNIAKRVSREPYVLTRLGQFYLNASFHIHDAVSFCEH